MRLTHWAIGLLLGVIASIAALEVGIFALLLIAPSLVWSARETTRPLGLGGFIAGMGSGFAALMILGIVRCAADPSCSSPDYTGYVGFGIVLAVAGLGVTIAALRTR